MKKKWSFIFGYVPLVYFGTFIIFVNWFKFFFVSQIGKLRSIFNIKVEINGRLLLKI